MVLLSHYMYQKLRDVISSNSVPANNFPVVFSSKPHKKIQTKELKKNIENLNRKKQDYIPVSICIQKQEQSKSCTSQMLSQVNRLEFKKQDFCFFSLLPPLSVPMSCTCQLWLPAGNSVSDYQSDYCNLRIVTIFLEFIQTVCKSEFLRIKMMNFQRTGEECQFS